MTRSAEEVAAAHALASDGLSATEISKYIGVPRSTIRHWLHVRVPRGRLGLHDLCEACGHAPHEPDDLASEYAYLFGIYLGDGCLSPHPRGVFKLRISLDARYPAIVDEVAAAIHAVRPLNPVARIAHSGADPEKCSWIEVYAYSRSWPCLFPQHGPGKKHERTIALEDWQLTRVRADPWSFLRGLIHSDGCRFINTGRGWSHPRYVFSNTSDDIRRIFCDTCDLLGLRWTTAPRRIYVSRKADVARMDEFIGPKA